MSALLSVGGGISIRAGKTGFDGREGNLDQVLADYEAAGRIKTRPFVG
ncbi:MAG: hypothetical protein KJS98_18355 [Nitrospirae bacterium]|nr:hypothetical protein [Nitrospirota bacterium]